MPEASRRSKPLAVTIFMAIAFPMMINALDSSSARKLDEEPIKCTPCLQKSPPPPSPPPPSPSCPPPPRPPTPPKTSYCPPPPSTYIYMTGPPGELYPVDQQFGEAAAKSFRAVKISGLIAFGVMGLLMNINSCFFFYFFDRFIYTRFALAECCSDEYIFSTSDRVQLE